jgi:predicted lipopolysaccharide heptosyltransferase III
MMDSILILRPDHIGDVLLTTPALHALRLGFPTAHIAVLVGSWSREILSGNPDVDEIIICNLPWLARGAQAGWRNVITTVRHIRQRNFDTIVNLRVAASTALFAVFCGGRTRWGFDVLKSRWAWTYIVPFDPTCHVVDASLDLVRAIGCPITDPPTLYLFPDEQAHHQADLLLREIVSSFVILNQGAGYLAKCWDPDRWAMVADRIAEQGLTPVFAGSRSEWKAVEAVRRRMRYPSVNIAGRCSLLGFAAVVEKSRCVITVDSAPMHIAVAMRTPVVALFGPTDSRRWGPYPNGCSNIVIEKQGDCRYCKRLKGCRERRCMKMIGVEEVTEAVESLL